MIDHQKRAEASSAQLYADAQRTGTTVGHEIERRRIAGLFRDPEPAAPVMLSETAAAEDWQNQDFGQVPFTPTDWANASATVGYLRKLAGMHADAGRPTEAMAANALADKLAVTRRKIQARVARMGE